MKLTVRWYGNRWYGKYADVVFRDDSETIELSCLDQAERSDLAQHLREIADELNPTTETP